MLEAHSSKLKAKSYLPIALAGFLVCDIFLVHFGDWKTSFARDAAALGGWPLARYLLRDVGYLVLPFVIVVLYLAAFRGRIRSANFTNRLITNIVGMCYSIYLFHFLVIYFVRHLTWPIHIGQSFWFSYFVQTCLILPVVLLFCGPFFVLIEAPAWIANGRRNCGDGSGSVWCRRKNQSQQDPPSPQAIPSKDREQHGMGCSQLAAVFYALTSDPIFSPSTTFRIFPGWLRLNTMIGRLLSLQSEMAVESITLSPCRRTSM